jgi:hypothetical protein
MVEPTGHCPYLGLKQNQAIRFASPTSEHRCYAAGQAQEIPTFEPNYQTAYCLSPNHIRCPLYTGSGLPSTPAAPPIRLEPAVAPAGGVRSWFSGLAPRDRAIYGFLVALLGVILLFYAIAGISLARNGALFGEGPPPPTLAPTADQGQLPGAPSPSPEPPPSATATAEPEPSATSRPTRTPAPTRTRAPERTPSPTPEPPTATPTNTAAPPTNTATIFVPPRPTIFIPPPPTNTPSDLIPIFDDTPTPTLEASSTSEPQPPQPTQGEAPTAEQTEPPTATAPPAPEPPTPEPPTATAEPTPELPTSTPGPTPPPARTP